MTDRGTNESPKRNPLMSNIKLITMYGSPWSEKVRWAFAFKGVPYEKQNYQLAVDEAEVKQLSGQTQVPVLLADGKVIPDSAAILNWLDDHRPQPSLMPLSEKERAQVTLWEEVIDGALGPHARMLITGRQLASAAPEVQQAGKFFAQKYHYSAFAEEHARFKVERILRSIKDTLSGHQYLVGEAFSRADLTVASMLMLVKPAPEELFFLPEPWRSTLTDSVSELPAFATLFSWRDQMYRMHRGEPVRP
jgi:glutathione S-transferase